MSEEKQNPEQDYLDRMEQHELTKSAGLDAWAEAVTGMLPNVDADKVILIKEGLKAALGGPPRPTMHIDPMNFIVHGPQSVDAEFVQPPSHIYEDTTSPDGSVTIWDWMGLTNIATHFTRYPGGYIGVFRGSETLARLSGEAAEKFWEWTDHAAKQYGQAIYIPGRHS